MNAFFKKLKNNIIKDDYRYYMQMIVIPAFLAIVSIIMTILNIIYKKELLCIATAFFALISIIIVVITVLNKKMLPLSKTLFILEVIGLFTYFLISGGTAGFSPYWICLLPACSMMAFNRKTGTIWSIIMFVIIILLLWTPLFDLVVNWEGSKPTQEFRIRFPVVYVAYFGIGYILEYIRELTHNKLVETNEKLIKIGRTDELTKLNNQLWLKEYIGSLGDISKNIDNLAVIFIDIDDFKSVNDNYGHTFGNTVLHKVADIIKENAPQLNCRWGGDEFAIMVENTTYNEAHQIADKVRRQVENLRFEENILFKITISAGVAFHDFDDEFNFVDVFNSADASIAHAKKSGKNKVYTVEI